MPDVLTGPGGEKNCSPECSRRTSASPSCQRRWKTSPAPRRGRVIVQDASKSRPKSMSRIILRDIGREDQVLARRAGRPELLPGRHQKADVAAGPEMEAPQPVSDLDGDVDVAEHQGRPRRIGEGGIEIGVPRRGERDARDALGRDEGDLGDEREPAGERDRRLDAEIRSAPPLDAVEPLQPAAAHAGLQAEIELLRRRLLSGDLADDGSLAPDEGRKDPDDQREGYDRPFHNGVGYPRTPVFSSQENLFTAARKLLE